MYADEEKTEYKYNAYIRYQRRQWHPTPVLLPGKIPWTEEPGRLQFLVLWEALIPLIHINFMRVHYPIWRNWCLWRLCNLQGHTSTSEWGITWLWFCLLQTAYCNHCAIPEDANKLCFSSEHYFLDNSWDKLLMAVLDQGLPLMISRHVLSTAFPLS